jgi:cytochrome c
MDWRDVGRKAVALLALTALAACGSGEREEHEEKSEGSGSDLSAFELENGIGPIKEKIELGALDPQLAESGRTVFETKCSMCHKMDTTYVGPSLGDVTTRRTPAFIMNMILNPQEMVERHPIAKQLLAERMTFMANQNLTVPEARAVLEYLRTQSRSSKPASKETNP